MQDTPSPNRKNAIAVCVIFLLISAILFASSVCGLKPRALLQLGSIFSLVVVVWVTDRYLLSRFVYRLVYSDDTFHDAEHTEFVVERISGSKKRTVLCRLPLHSAVSCEPKSSQKAHPEDNGAHVSAYRFTVSLFPKQIQILTFLDREDIIRIAFEPSEAMRLEILDLLATKNISSFWNEKTQEQEQK